jgi:precorrin-6Y C5,15-methyltransferase (decarboxylating)
MKENPVQQKWLALIGIGEDGVEGLSPAARRLLTQAHFVIGGKRHLALAGALNGETMNVEIMAWPSPIVDAIPAILARRDSPVCVLASGDPFFYGIGSLLSAHIDPREMLCLPAPSAFSLAAARLGWALQDCRLVSLHGRDFERIIPHLQPRARILCLSWDETTPPRLAELLCRRGLGGSHITILEAMGGPRECVRSFQAADFTLDVVIDPLNVVAIETVSEAQSKILPLGTGIPDEWFETDGQLTKREIRVMTLSALAPARGDLLWDIGAGSGSIAIEWLLLDPANRAIAIEEREDRAARIFRNAAALGVPQLEVIVGRAPEALIDLPRPQAIFVGGGASDAALLDQALAILPAAGRLVVNAVTLETQCELIRRYKTLGGDLVSVQISRADPIGSFHSFRPALPITQWAIKKQ